MSLLFYLLESTILVLSLTTDALTAGFSYGVGRIKIPPASLFVISTICSGMFAISLLSGALVSSFLSADTARILCFILLFSIGAICFFDQYLKNYIQKHQEIDFHFTAHNLNFILTVYADMQAADADQSKILSVKEAAFLAAALSIDSLAAGFGAALSGGNIFLPVLLCFIFTILAIRIGTILGSRFSKALPFDLSYLSSLLFIVLAFLRLF